MSDADVARQRLKLGENFGFVRNAGHDARLHKCGRSLSVRWRWGVAHDARSEHRPFARVAALARIFDVRVPVPGDTYTVNVNRHTIRNAAEPFVSRHAASLRAIYDMADPERSLFMHSTGQSGLPTSRLYRNLAERWAKVEFLPMRTRRADIEREAIGTLTIVPR